jgi:hypothetical protein
MTSVINISRNSRIDWPGNSIYLYQGVICLCTCLRFYLLLFITVDLLLSHCPFSRLSCCSQCPFSWLRHTVGCWPASSWLRHTLGCRPVSSRSHSIGCWPASTRLRHTLGCCPASWPRLLGAGPASSWLRYTLGCWQASWFRPSLGCWPTSSLLRHTLGCLAGFLAQSLSWVLAGFVLALAHSWVPGRFPGAVTLLDVGRLLPGSDTLGCWPASWLRHQLGRCPVVLLLAPHAHPHTRTQAHPHTGTPAHPHTHLPQWPSFSLAAPRPAHAPGRFIWVLRSFYSHPGRRTWAGPVVRWGSLAHTRRLPLCPPETGPPRPPARSPSPRLAPCRTPASLTPAAQARGHALAVTAAGPGAVLTRVSQSRFPGRAWSPELLSVRAGPSNPRWRHCREEVKL